MVARVERQSSARSHLRERSGAEGLRNRDETATIELRRCATQCGADVERQRTGDRNVQRRLEADGFLIDEVKGLRYRLGCLVAEAVEAHDVQLGGACQKRNVHTCIG